ncbi:MAG: chromosome segregation protein SMC [Candidatus Marinimicrobia bacterium]|nr:chromosome segregation protein SMC [Candidatus Neomarinimicrobiota bacterium]MCF7880268.1 chromosome segregation protein SMC [Candidatus Neomarinimicrobiota bacterium]
MYISKLEIFGFKSFAKKTELKFGPGTTGIVGPNGCGKTNVVDAIRWVLGEQKTTVLRSDNMSEVIFNGSKTMKPLGMCEVSLTIHNNKGILPIEFNDVVVTRRLYRDGQSEYLLNKKVCRLKDIQNLFIDTGMGSDAYSVIELKMVEDILSDTKDERTRMFEEAAGVNKYKQERRAARRKLDATKEDLLRLNDILYEIEKNVSSLKRQMRKYERYQRYQNDLKTKEIDLAGHKLWKIERDIHPLEQQLEQGKDFQSSSAEQLEIDEALQESLKQKIQKQEARVEGLDQDLGEIDEQRQNSQRNILVWEEQKSAAEKSLERLRQEESNLEDRQKQTKVQIKELNQSLEEMEPKLREIQSRYADQQEVYQQIDGKYQEIRDTLNEYQDEKIESITELADLRNKRERLIENRDRANSEIVSLRESIESLGEELHEKERKFRDLQQELEVLETGDVDREERVAEFRDQQETLQESIDKTRESLLKKESTEDVLRSKIDFYQELIENREGFSSAVQFLTGEHTKVDGIIGTVADILKVDDDYQLAVENALGDQAEYLLATTRDAALGAIDVVTRSKRGRVSVIPLDMVKNLSIPSDPPDNGATRLTDFLDYDDKYSGVVQLLLGDVLLTDSLQSVSTDGEDQGKWRYVTRSGEVLERSSIMRGGKSDSEYSSRVGRQETLDELQEELEKNLSGQEDIKGKLSKLREEYEAIQNSLNDLESAEQEQVSKRRELDQSISRLDYDIKRTKQQRQEHDQRIEDFQSQIQEIEGALKEIEPALTELQERRQQLQQRVDEAEEDLEEISERRTTENNKLQDLRLEVASVENEQKTLSIRLSNSKETLQDISDRFESIQKERDAARTTIQERKESLESEREKLSELEEQYRQLKQRREEEHGVLKKRQAEMEEVEARIKEKHRERESQYDRIRNIERQISELESEERSIKERMRDRYGIDAKPEQMDDEKETSPEELSQEIESLRSRIDRMGPVNLAVKEEYEEEQERLDFLTEQRDDLLEAEEDLLETIQRIDTQANSQFNEIFQEIRKHFQQTFIKFFPGGEADLQLEGDSDPLEADIVISANPGGKKLQSLRVLSAGEKTLTAIALLFAIYLVKPSPFCILDEVDAPLDDRNSQIFTGVVEDFAEDTQFIIVTHNKITMEAANYMYGITMQDEGVSKVVSVQFD